ncbi:redoxin domain-containing protein [Actinomadura namibiensis]|uniref:Thiol-disulfide isomerase/thioredoxin n=1 Tax=Actinomadura namibiensis TaxID=182080 RepID=A0A7W3LUY3_ACTNM|nr:redoxin domain-containing protein [Actinomadura namibiensis]MBA8954768.1 thiol-disulfide isomerase/thioredoxin [Actinomadura namibiensis]
MNKLLPLVTGAILLAGCGGSGGSGAGGGTPPAPVPSATAPSPSGSPAKEQQRLRKLPDKLRFEATTLDGRPFTGVNLAEKPAVFWFWAPWCPKCRAEGPAVAKAARANAGRVEFVGVAGLDQSTARMKEFVTRTGTSGLPHLDDRNGRLYRHFGVTTQSSFLFMRPDGTAERASGPLGEDELAARVRALAGG